MPFTSEELLRTFGRYNAAFWPVSALLFALAVLMVGLTFVRPRAVDRVGPGFLSLLWAWTGVGFHLVLFTAINPAAFLFGALFLAQAALFARAALGGKPVPMRLAADRRSAMALALVGYALVGYSAHGSFRTRSSRGNGPGPACGHLELRAGRRRALPWAIPAAQKR